MSQRLISKTRRTLIGTTSRGLAVFAIGGAEDDDEDESDGNDDENSGGDGSEGQNTDNKDGEGDGTGSGAAKTYSAEEFAALEARMKAADQNASKANAKIKEIEDAKKGDLEKAVDKVADLEKTVTEKDKVITDLRFENAFALDNAIIWNDPQMALSQVRNRPEVTIEEDGTVKGLSSAIKALAKEKPFLVKKDTSEEKPPKTGSGTGTGKKTEKKLDEARLARKYKI